MTGVKRLIIADSHVGQGRGDAAAMNAHIRCAAARGVAEIIYLGDAFQYLIGMSKFWTSSVHEVLAVWRELRAEGVRIGIVEGNRDFFLDEAELSAELDWSGRSRQFVAGDRRYLLVHGDLVNRRDLAYRFWSTVSKSSMARLWARVLPRRLAVAIVRHMESHLAKTNLRFRSVKPVQDLERSAEAAWAEGFDVLFWGHFHSPWICRSGGHIALVMPAWLETRTSVLVDDSGAWAVVGADLEPRPLDMDGAARPEPVQDDS
jgi:UDP-2,3-diacylglucosamine pyrophosphatase LpxH